MLHDMLQLLMCSTTEQLHWCDGGLKPPTAQTHCSESQLALAWMAEVFGYEDKADSVFSFTYWIHTDTMMCINWHRSHDTSEWEHKCRGGA